MPLRTDPEALLRAAPPELRVVLDEVFAAIGRVCENDAPPWTSDPATVRFVALAAWAMLADKIRIEEGRGMQDSRATAALRLGFGETSFERRLQRARGATECRTSSATAAATVRSTEPDQP